jgi:hypothetical protein
MRLCTTDNLSTVSHPTCSVPSIATESDASLLAVDRCLPGVHRGDRLAPGVNHKTGTLYLTPAAFTCFCLGTPAPLKGVILTLMLQIP